MPADCFAEVLQGIQKAIRLMVEHLAGRDPGPGRPPQWVRNQSTIGLVATRPGSMMVELALAPPDGQTDLLDYGPQAIVSLLNWSPNGDDSHLPRHVEEGITAMSAALPEDTTLFLGTPDDTRRVVLHRTKPLAARESEAEEALLQGWLKEVNWYNRTGQLHQAVGSYIRLRFGPDLDEDMLRLATQYVEVMGSGTFRDDDNWRTVRVETVRATRSWRDPFDLEEFLNDPNSKIFDPTDIVTLALTREEWESFDRAICEGREA